MLWVATYGGGLMAVEPVRGVVDRRVNHEGWPIERPNLFLPRGWSWQHLGRYPARGGTLYPGHGRCPVIGRAMGMPADERVPRALPLTNQGQVWAGTGCRGPPR